MKGLCLTLAGLALAVTCAPAAPLSAPPPAPPTLAQALAQAQAPRDTVYLAVGADKVTLPRGGAPLLPGDPVPQVAGAYGRLTRGWETAAAVAPPTMTVLNAAPGTPDPYDGMPPADALKLLLGGLDDGQWQALTGSQGLGYDGLTDQKQQDLFRDLFPDDTLKVQRGDDDDPQHETTLTADDLRQARLRLSRKATLLLQTAGSPGGHSGSGAEPDDGKDHYTVSSVHSLSKTETLYGAQVRATVPNAPKPSDLDAAALTVPVPLAGLKTVGDLVGRIGAATKTELYADVRYETRTVTVVGPPSARAGDLLRALALCVCGAYRKVGPAYVLTDDVVGLGRRQMILARFAEEADAARIEDLAGAGDRLVARGGVLGLPPTAPDLGLTPAQLAAQKADPSWDPFGVFVFAPVPFGQLTPAQQDLARKEFRLAQGQHQAFGDRSTPVTLGGTVLVQTQPLLQLLSPAVPGPVAMDTSGLLFQPSAGLRQQLDEQRQAQAVKLQGAAPPAAAPPPPSPAALLAPLPRRAVYARPRTATEVDALVASMRRAGLNQLWLDVFSQGKSHLDAKPADGKPDILTEALARTQATGISVVPTLDLLDWGPDAPEGVRDRTVLGETSARYDDDLRRVADAYGGGMTAADPPMPAGTLAVCPAAPAVVERMTALVGRLAATPGVTTLALQGTTASGYRAPDGGLPHGTDLGYTPPLRLACLRRTHVDPVDLDVGVPEEVRDRTSLPDFWADTGTAMQDAGRGWDALRVEADLDLMRRLLAAARTAAGHPVPFLVRQRGSAGRSDWWGLWGDPRAPLPAMLPGVGRGTLLTGLAPFAHTQCPVDVYALPAASGRSSEALAFALLRMKSGWDGVVLDAGSPDGGDPLAALAAGASPAPLPSARKP